MGLGGCRLALRVGGRSRVIAWRGLWLWLGVGGGRGPGWLDDQLHCAAVALEADHGTAVLLHPGEWAEDAAAGIHPVGLHPPVSEPVGAKLRGDDPVGGGWVDAGAVFQV